MFAKMKKFFIIIKGQSGSKHHPVKFQTTLVVVGATQRLNQWSVLIKSNEQENHIKKNFKKY